ncbi:MAG: glucosaminidase domain-containing protein [Candidatus Desulfofervidaceae bacterium]|nr:glucosaminidase domain-containing protein [Candidatus Desulfofervidaceae bacterium]
MKRKKFFKKIICVGALLLSTISCKHNYVQTPRTSLKVTIIKVNTTQELLEVLKKHGLWQLEGLTKMPPIVIKNLPPDLKYVRDERLKRKLFIRTIMPSALFALAEVEKERMQLKEILAETDYPTHLDSNILVKTIGSQKAAFVRHLTAKYRTNVTDELLKRVNTVPLSLLLAQAAIESNWGTSRFALEGNNLFGIWTYKRDGMVPLYRDTEAQHKVARYSSILEATRNYLYNLNVGWAYTEFREARSHTMDALELAQYLFRYSQTGLLYVNRLQDIINMYNLKEYDIYEAHFKPYLAQFNLCCLDNQSLLSTAKGICE